MQRFNREDGQKSLGALDQEHEAERILRREWGNRTGCSKRFRPRRQRNEREASDTFRADARIAAHLSSKKFRGYFCFQFPPFDFERLSVARTDVE